MAGDNACNYGWIVGGLPTFIPTEETERISVEEAIEYLGKIPIPRLMSNTLEDCIEQNKYVLAIKMGIEALLKQIHKENKLLL